MASAGDRYIDETVGTTGKVCGSTGVDNIELGGNWPGTIETFDDTIEQRSGLRFIGSTETGFGDDTIYLGGAAEDGAIDRS